MDNLFSDYRKKTKLAQSLFKPQIFNLKIGKDREGVKKLFSGGFVSWVVDNYEEQYNELVEISGQVRGGKPNTLGKSDSDEGLWVYYPWRACLVHILSKEQYMQLRVSRNFPLITVEEQTKFANAKIGFAGLNVGNPGAICIALEGGGLSMKFADFDSLSLSNLNRFRAGLCELGTSKIVISARQVYEINPFADVDMFASGLDEKNIDLFLTEPKIDLLIEEMDNLKLKIKIRKKAKKYKIPVIMVTAEGIIDVERYDLNPELEILSGHLRDEVIKKINLVSPGTPTKERVMLARDFVGKEFLSTRLKDSFDMIGEKIPSIPQLSEWTFLRGAILCYFARMIITGENVPSGRYHLRLPDSLRNKSLPA